MELTNIIVSFLIMTSGYFLIRVSEKHISKLRDSLFNKHLVKHSKYSDALFWYFSYFIKLIAYVIIGLISISVLGFEPQVLGIFASIMALAIIGIVAYSLKDVIPSMVAGAYIFNSKLIKKGDSISFNGMKGKVIDINLITITLKDSKGIIAIIPNKLIMNKIFKKH